jgi:hypothetical protein
VFTLTLEELLDQTKHEYRTYTSVPGRYKAFTAGPHPVWGTRSLIPSAQRYSPVNAQKSGTDIRFMPMLLFQLGLTAFIMDEALNELIMGTNPGAAAKLYAATHTNTNTNTYTLARTRTPTRTRNDVQERVVLTPAIGACTQVGARLQAARFYASIRKG